MFNGYVSHYQRVSPRTRSPSLLAASKSLPMKPSLEKAAMTQASPVTFLRPQQLRDFLVNPPSATEDLEYTSGYVTYLGKGTNYVGYLDVLPNM